MLARGAPRGKRSFYLLATPLHRGPFDKIMMLNSHLSALSSKSITLDLQCKIIGAEIVVSVGMALPKTLTALR